VRALAAGPADSVPADGLALHARRARLSLCAVMAIAFAHQYLAAAATVVSA